MPGQIAIDKLSPLRQTQFNVFIVGKGTGQVGGLLDFAFKVSAIEDKSGCFVEVFGLSSTLTRK